MVLWHWTCAVIQNIPFRAVSRQAPTFPPPSAAMFPQEIVDVIIDHLFYDSHALQACSLTCRSWYIAALPHLHHSVVTGPTEFITGYGSPSIKHMCQLSSSQTIISGLRPDNFLTNSLWWTAHVRRMYKLGLFPFIKKFHIRTIVHLNSREMNYELHEFSPELFDHQILRQFSALTNVRDLAIDSLDIPSFIPELRRYFGHFIPTVQSLTLKRPKGSRRQIVFFIGLFQHLEDLKLPEDEAVFQDELPDDPTLVPPFIPPLRGRLTMSCFTRIGVVEDMISLFGGIRFRHMDLFYTYGMRLLLDAAAESLETLRLYPNDPRSERVLTDVLRAPLTISQPEPATRILTYRETYHSERSKSP